VQHHVTSLVQKAPAPMARAPKAPVMHLTVYSILKEMKH
jgi:hypothetical protein